MIETAGTKETCGPSNGQMHIRGSPRVRVLVGHALPRDVAVLSDTESDQGENRGARPATGAGGPAQSETGQGDAKLQTMYSKRLLRCCGCKNKCHLWCQSEFQRCWGHRQAWAGKATADQDRELFNVLQLRL